MGVMVAAAGIGGLTLPPLAGAIADSFGLRVAVMSGAVMSAAAAAAAFWGKVFADRDRVAAALEVARKP